jgi:hypothetical protein
MDDVEVEVEGSCMVLMVDVLGDIVPELTLLLLIVCIHMINGSL